MARDVIVLVEHTEGKVDSITPQLVAIGRQLAGQMDGKLAAMAIGYRLEAVMEAIQAMGIDRIVVVDRRMS